MNHSGDFLTYIRKIRHYSPHTVSSYKQDLEQYFIFCETSDKESVHQQIRKWISYLFEQGISSRSINRKISTLKSYYKYLMHEGLIDNDPLSRIMRPRTGKKLPSFVQEGHMNKLLDEVEFGSDYVGLRNKLIIETFYNTGIRLTELINIKKSDIDVYGNYIKVLGKYVLIILPVRLKPSSESSEGLGASTR